MGKTGDEEGQEAGKSGARSQAGKVVCTAAMHIIRTYMHAYIHARMNTNKDRPDLDVTTWPGMWRLVMDLDGARLGSRGVIPRGTSSAAALRRMGTEAGCPCRRHREVVDARHGARIGWVRRGAG